MMEIKPDFLIIPLPVVADDTLQPNDRLLYGVIYWLERLKDGTCTASNSTLGSVIGVEHPLSVANSLKRLEDGGYIKRIYKDKAHKKRKNIECLLTYSRTPAVSSNDDRVSSDDDSKRPPVSSNDEQNKKESKSKRVETPRTPTPREYNTTLFAEGEVWAEGGEMGDTLLEFARWMLSEWGKDLNRKILSAELKKFIGHWGAMTLDGKKAAWADTKNKTFNAKLRMGTWIRNVMKDRHD